MLTLWRAQIFTHGVVKQVLGRSLNLVLLHLPVYLGQPFGVIFQQIANNFVFNQAGIV